MAIKNDKIRTSSRRTRIQWLLVLAVCVAQIYYNFSRKLNSLNRWSQDPEVAQQEEVRATMESINMMESSTKLVQNAATTRALKSTTSTRIVENTENSSAAISTDTSTPKISLENNTSSQTILQHDLDVPRISSQKTAVVYVAKYLTECKAARLKHIIDTTPSAMDVWLLHDHASSKPKQAQSSEEYMKSLMPRLQQASQQKAKIRGIDGTRSGAGPVRVLL